MTTSTQDQIDTRKTEIKAISDRELKRLRDQVDPIDGALSSRCGTFSQMKLQREIDILENDGKAEFWGLFKDGERVKARLCDGDFGAYWMLFGDDDKPNGCFIPAKFGKATKRAKISKLGFTEAKEMAPAWCKLQGSISGAMWVRDYRKDGGWPEGAKVVSF